VTDANLILGRLAADRFLGGQMSLDLAAVEAALTRLGRTAGLSAGAGLSLAQTAALGMIQVVNAHMERALRVISLQRGHDPRDFTLVSFGGAGGLHAVELARSLRLPTVLIPPNAATLSAFGMLPANVVRDYVRTIMVGGHTPYAEIQAALAPLVEQGLADLAGEGIPATETTLEPLLDMRYHGQSYEVTVPFTPDFLAGFHAAHAQAYGYSEPGVPVELVNLRLRAIGRLPRPALTPAKIGPADPGAAIFDRRPVVLAGGIEELPFFNGPDLRPGHQIAGPAVVVHPDTTIFLGRADKLLMDGYHNLVIRVGE
jgi:N-methylhydantoinase A